MKGMKLLVFGLLALPAVVSCDNECAPSAEIGCREVTLGLSLDNRFQTRAAIGGGVLDGQNYIIQGDYGIIIQLPGYNDRVHCCRFGTSSLDNGRRGNIYLVKENKADAEPGAAPLKWSEIEVKTFDFIIDNIGYKEECKYDAERGFIGRSWSEAEKSKTYAAQREQYDDATGEPLHTNDIIWGAGTALYGNDGKDVSYAELTHRMTRLNVAFINLTEQQQKGMTVTLSNLVLEPESFNRADGTVAIAANPERKNLSLLNELEELAVITDETAEGTYEEHVTANYILPPQPLAEEKWPEIIVTYTDEEGDKKEVRGLVPHDILNEDGNSWEGLDALSAGDHLTIVAEIKEGIPDIVFTAKVRKWVELGPVTVVAGQYEGTPGIHSMEDLERCIELYNSLPQFNDLPNSWVPSNGSQRLTNLGELMKYGDCKKDKFGCLAWEFTIDFDLSKEESMPQTGFRYMLCRLDESDGSLKEYTYPLEFEYKPDPSKNEYVSGLIEGPKGIYNIEDLNCFIKAVNEGNAWFASFFAEWYFSDDGRRLKFPVAIRDDLSGNLIGKIDKQKLDGLNFNGIPVDIVLITNGFTLDGEENIGELIGIE